MLLSSKYNHSSVEAKWYKFWMDKKYFSSSPNPKKQPYSIVIPPPNVTGVLHMGHMLNNTIQDVLIRKARMENKEACWVPGVDHASIATEAKVVNMLREKGISKKDLTRDQFLEYAWEWKNKYGDVILEQLKKIGASCDWDRTIFTMDENYHAAVVKVFVDLYNKGFIYRDYRMVNWDVEAQTTISNEEVLYKEGGEQSKLYYIKYQLLDDDADFIIIATQRPETIMGDTAIAVNPKDERYQHLIGKKVLVPFINRVIPIIGDEYVELEFGTGCLKVTPAHDPNDYEIGKTHNLEVIDSINQDGTLNELCEISKFVGKDRFDVRKQIVKDLASQGLLVKEESFTTRIGRSERTGTVVEPKLSLQWFIKMKDISKRAHTAVMEDEVTLFPSKFKNTYNYWMDNVRDWCISRQLWWGQQIPAYYYGQNQYVVANTKQEALELAKIKSGDESLTANDLRQDEDVLDTWASSWLFPLSSFNGFNEECFIDGKIDLSKNEELNYYYPTAVLVTAPEILFFWVARMIIAGYEYTDKKPFNDVYLTGLVRDKKRRKMSKSLGNSPDPLDLIQKYGADAVRTGMLFSSPAGNDLLYDEKLIEQGRNFGNKLWNAFRLIQSWETNEKPPTEDELLVVRWINSKLNLTITEVEQQFDQYRISEALMIIYKFVWDDFCSWFLEIVKPEYQTHIGAETKNQIINVFEKVLKILHPFMPFITEELYKKLSEKEENDCLIVSKWPKINQIDEQLIEKSVLAFKIINNIRNIRNTNQLKNKSSLKLMIISKDFKKFNVFKNIIKKLGHLSDIEEVHKKTDNSVSFVISGDEYFIPLPHEVDKKNRIIELEKQLNYAKGFLNSVEKKLNNSKFLESAPEHIVELERKKMMEAKANIQILENSLNQINKS